MLFLVFIKNCNLCVCCILILSNKLDLNEETHFTIAELKLKVGLDNRTVHIRHLCRKTAALSCHRCLINTGVEKMNYI